MDGCDGTLFTPALDRKAKIPRPDFKITTIINRGWEDSFAFPENQGSLPSTYMVAHNSATPRSDTNAHKKYVCICTYIYT